MDTKALAKSKRAHTLHHSNKTSHHKKPTKPQSKGATKPLPSNWDRYEHEDEEDTKDEEKQPSSSSSSKAVENDVVLVKSKGADFAYLVAQAQSQCHSGSYLDDPFVTGDFDNGIGSMLSVRGEGILSWLGNDNFVVQDGTAAADHEASFLSLNLHTLAEQLTKVDAPERLFIEADLLPPEMSSQGSKTSSIIQESDQMPTTESGAGTTIPNKNKHVNQKFEVISSGTTAGGYAYLNPFNKRSDLLNQVKGDLSFNQEDISSQSEALESQKQLNSSPTVDYKKEPSTFEAATAEAELDMLLDSFGEANLLDNPSSSTSGILPVSQENWVAQPQLTRNPPVPSKTTSIAASVEGVLDDLLEETSTLSNQYVSYKPSEVKAINHGLQSSSPPESVTKSKVLDDFDSWLDTI